MSEPDVGAWRSQEELVAELLPDRTSVVFSCIRHASEVLR
jgi:hypothetical protein